MKLKHIELKGFKSFAKKEKLDFEKRITAIVGPNGSGKSNIAEAFRFVLGEQSMKSMRSKKTEDLLFNGSAALPRTNRASVTLTFDNSTRSVGRVFDEVEVERVIHRDSTNEYYINGSPVRLKDIIELLSEAKIGTAGHHIISQGQADSLLAMSARERKSHIEEALGLTQYQLKKTEAEKKLKKTEENLDSIRSLRRENAPHLKYLEREMKLIETRRKVILELEEKSRDYAKRFVTFLSISKEENQKEHQELLSCLEETEEKLGHLEHANAATTEDTFLQELERKVQSVDNELRVLQIEKGELAHSVGKLEAELEFRSETNDAGVATLEIKDATERLVSIKSLLEEVSDEDDINKLHRAIDQAISIAGFEDGSNEDTEQTENISIERISQVQIKLKELEQKSADLVEKEKALHQRREEALKTINEKQKEREGARIEAEKSVYESRSLKLRLSSLEQEMETLRAEEGRFYSSLEEIALIANIRFSKEVLSSDVTLDNISRNELQSLDREVEKLKLKIESMQVGDTREVERAYTEAKERAEFLDREIADLEKSISKLNQIAKELGQRIETEFSSGLKQISGFFSTYFSHMFKGGSAELVSVVVPQRREEENDEKEFGVDIKVRMPHKNLRSTAMLSGGEKTLVSIALIFALSQVNPPPFLILDETDAALDEANSRRYGEALGELSKYSQLILITHNRETMSHAGMLYGITMGRSASSELLSIDLEEAEKIAK